MTAEWDQAVHTELPWICEQNLFFEPSPTPKSLKSDAWAVTCSIRKRLPLTSVKPVVVGQGRKLRRRRSDWGGQKGWWMGQTNTDFHLRERCSHPVTTCFCCWRKTNVNSHCCTDIVHLFGKRLPEPYPTQPITKSGPTSWAFLGPVRLWLKLRTLPLNKVKKSLSIWLDSTSCTTWLLYSILVYSWTKCILMCPILTFPSASAGFCMYC